MNRINVLDALRGFSLFGVIIIHMIQQFGIRNISIETSYFDFPLLDYYSRLFAYNVVMGRFINIFAILFGISFYIQIKNSYSKKNNFNYFFLRRMAFLFILGIAIHSFYNVEILSVYAIFGVVLLIIKKVNNSILLLIAALLFIGFPRIIQSVNHNKNITQEIIKSNSPINQNETVAEYLSKPSLVNSIKDNYSRRLKGKINYQFGMFGRGYVTLGLFLIGFLVGRSGFLENINRNKIKIKKMFIISIIVFTSLSIFNNLLPEVNTRSLFVPGNKEISFELLLVKSVQDLLLVVSSFILSLGFILLYNLNKYQKYLDQLSPYGRAALTNYTLQGLFGLFLFSPWALGSYFSNFGNFSLLIIGIFIYIIQMLVSNAYLKKYRYGPLEWLWRSFSYKKIQKQLI